MGTARGVWAAGLAAGTGRRAPDLAGWLPGPPGRNNLPVVIGRAIAFPRGVGLETDVGDSPWGTWMAPDL